MQERELLWKKERPSFLTRIIDRKTSETWSENCSLFRKKRLAAIEELSKCKTLQKELRNLLLEQNNIECDREEKLLDRAMLYYAHQETYHKLKQAHPTARLPNDIKELKASIN